MRTRALSGRWLVAAAASALLLTGCVVQGKTTGGTPPGAEPTVSAVAADVPISAEAAAAAVSADYLWVVTSAGGRITGVGQDTGTEQLTLTLTGVRDYATQFTDRPERAAYVLPTAQFAQKWAEWFADAPPNAVLSFVPPEGPTPRAIVLELTNPVYDGAADTLTFSAVHLHRQPLAYPGAQAPIPPRVTPPETFASGSVFIDPAQAGSGKVFGMGVGYWQKYHNDDWSTAQSGYFDDLMAVIAPHTQWITNYGLAFPTDMELVRAAHRAGLQVAVTPEVTWTAAGADSGNAAQINNAITLVQEGVADTVVIGNEILSKLGPPPLDYQTWSQDMLTYINQVKNARTPSGKPVPVGTSYAGNVYDFDGEKYEEAVNTACDFVQITVHPANWAHDGSSYVKITSVADGVAFLQKSYNEARAKLNSWGLTGTKLQIRETGWPTAANNGSNQSLFTPANAADYFQQVQSWATSSGVDVFWFEAVDEPQKATAMDPAGSNAYDLQNYDANWGIWHFTPSNQNDVFDGSGPWGDFGQPKY